MPSKKFIIFVLIVLLAGAGIFWLSKGKILNTENKIVFQKQGNLMPFQQNKENSDWEQILLKLGFSSSTVDAKIFSKDNIEDNSWPSSNQTTGNLFPEIDYKQTINTALSLSLSLPIISDKEIIIDSSGISNVENYINYLSVNSSKISFDGKKFDSVLKDKNKIFLFVSQLVEKAVKEGLTEEIKNSLLVHKDFIEAKIVFLKSIKVSGEAVFLHKKMIGFDNLTIDLIEKTLDLENGKISKTDLNNFYQRYQITANSERKDLLKKAGLAAKEPNFINKIIAWLGLEDEFYALAAGLPPFGGQISAPILCPCSLSFLVEVGLPTPPITGFLLVPYAFLGSPLFFDYKSIRPGAWWLGLYNPAIAPCLIPCPPACCPIGLGNPIYMTGTSY